MSASEQLQKRTRAIFNPSDPNVRAWIADPEGIPAVVINTPSDYNRGALANDLEYLKDLAISLLEQMNMQDASTEWLVMINNELIGIPRWPGESDEDYAARVARYIIAPKLSRAAIINECRQFSSTEPVIERGYLSAAFSGLSFAGVDALFRNESPGDKFGWWVFPARTASSSDSSYSIVVVLTDTEESDLSKLFDVLDRWVHPGIRWSVRIEQT